MCILQQADEQGMQFEDNSQNTIEGCEVAEVSLPLPEKRVEGRQPGGDG